MVLVIYNSNPQNKPDISTLRGWSLYSKEDWASICVSVDNYFFYMPPDDAELAYQGVSYYAYEEWLSDYQVSEVDMNKFMVGYQNIDVLLGTDFYVPDIAQNPDDEPIYPEMDVD